MTLHVGTILNPRHLLDWDDRKGYAGYSPSAAYLTTLYTKEFYDNRREYTSLAMQQFTSGTWLKLDASHKAPKKIFVDGHKIFSTMLTVSNEYGQVSLTLFFIHFGSVRGSMMPTIFHLLLYFLFHSMTEDIIHVDVRLLASIYCLAKATRISSSQSRKYKEGMRHLNLRVCGVSRLTTAVAKLSN